MRKCLIIAFAALLLLAGCSNPTVVMELPPVEEAVETPAPPSATPEPTPEPITGQLVTVNCDEFLPVRQTASLDAAEVGRATVGTELGVTGFEGIYAQINGQGLNGYVLSGYLQPKDPDPYLSEFEVVEPVELYSYDMMMADLTELAEKYPDRLTIETAGKSGMGKDIPVAVVDGGGETGIFVQASIQSREHMTTTLAMAQLEYLLKFEPDLHGVSVHIMPMSNPDGVTFAQECEIADEDVYERVYKIYGSDGVLAKTNDSFKDYLMRWQANSYGVDLNRNFPAEWELIEGAEEPSCDDYKGEKAGSEAETKALMEYTQDNDFAATLSYHAYGCNLYWRFGEDKSTEINQRSRELAEAIVVDSGFNIKDSNSRGGYKDWAMTNDIPSVTVEIGARRCPMPIDEFAMIWQRSRTFVELAAAWAAQ